MKGQPLATVADPAQIECLRPLIAGRACVALGSAPLTQPLVVADDELLIAVNGGISSAPRDVDVWFIGSKAQDRPGDPFIRPLHRTMLDQARGRSVRYACLLRGPKVASEHYTLAALRKLNCSVEAWSVLDKPTKLQMEQQFCGRRGDKEPCSSGILATAVALFCGAASVRLAGMSLEPGYNYLPREKHPPHWWRGHVAEDRRALITLRARYGERLIGDLVDAVAA